MNEIRKKLIPTEVKYGLLMLTDLPRDLLPQPKQKIVVIDADGERFEARMHSSTLRVDGLTHLHRKHQTFKGQTVTLRLDPEKRGILYVSFGGPSTEGPKTDNLAQTSRIDLQTGNNKVVASFDTILDEIDKSIVTVNRQGAQAFETGKHEIARKLMEKVTRMTTYRDRIQELRDEWSKNMQ
jgi:hypothetical protein